MIKNFSPGQFPETRITFLDNVTNVLEENKAFTMTVIGGSLEVNVGL